MGTVAFAGFIGTAIESYNFFLSGMRGEERRLLGEKDFLAG
jgi:hypothetical protein